MYTSKIKKPIKKLQRIDCRSLGLLMYDPEDGKEIKRLLMEDIKPIRA